jgi:dihydrofolate reductase
MEKARVSAIAAIGRNRELGRGNDLLWRIPEDLKRVKALTMGHPLIMGRKTYESIGRPLPGRTIIVVSRSGSDIPGCIVKSSVEEAIAYARSIETGEIFIFGGAQIYAAALPYTDRLYLTLIEAEAPDADVFFPDYADFSAVIKKEQVPGGVPAHVRAVLERPER